MKRIVPVVLRLVCLGLLLALAVPARAAVTAELDRAQVAPGETVVLRLVHEGRTGSEPDLSPLQQDFEVLATSRGTKVQLVNGAFSSQTQVSVTLSPKRSGTLTIPAIAWDGEQTPPLQLQVARGSGGTAGGAAPVFLETTVDEPRPYLQAGVVAKVRLYTDQPLYQASLALEGSDELMVQPLGEDRQTRETRDGVAYNVVERKYLVVPQRSGIVQIEGPVLDAQIADRTRRGPFGGNSLFEDFFGNSPFSGAIGGTRPLRVRGDTITLDVQPRPAAASSDYWLPARALSLEASWTPESGAVRAGEPVSLHLRLSAEGLTATQLPDLAALLQLPAGLKAYPDQPQLENEVRKDTLVARREQDIALIAREPGTYTIPELRLKWWDTVEDREREIRLPRRTLEILPAVGAQTAVPVAPAEAEAQAAGGAVASPPPAAGPPVRRGIWFWLSLALGLLWLATVALWLRALRRRKSPPRVPAVAATPDPRPERRRQAFLAACLADDAPAARRELLAWAALHWPQDPPRGLHALAERLDDWKVASLLRSLDRACYAGAAWRGEPLAQALTELPPADVPSQGKAGLAPLYN